MDNYNATEQAYKNGYEKGSKDTAKKIWDIAKITVVSTKYIIHGCKYLHLDALKEIIKSCGVEIKE